MACLARAYLLSEVVVLGLVAVVQAALLVLVGLAGVWMPSQGAFLTAAPLAELMLDVAVFSVTSMALGLVVSAFARSQDLALLMGILLAIGQVMLTGAVLQLGSVLKVIADVFRRGGASPRPRPPLTSTPSSRRAAAALPTRSGPTPRPRGCALSACSL